MYRKPILTHDDIDDLVGQIVRLEYSPYDSTNHNRWVGKVCQSREEGYRSSDYIFFTRADGENDSLLTIGGTNIVFATTIDSFIPPEEEEPFRALRWHERGRLLSF